MEIATDESPGGRSASAGARVPTGRLPLAEALEILVFTYNRADALRRTLAALVDSPFSACRITILDNCSTDHTPDVSAEFAQRFDRLRVVRHSRNIGLGPNYLRAVELSRARYSWILSDDEHLDFSRAEDVLEAIEAGEVDLISLGTPGQHDWERGLRTTTRELLDRGQRYFWVWTFAAGVIFRTERFDSAAVSAGYRHLHGDYAHFPHFEFVYACLREDRSVYVSREVIVARGDGHAPRTAGSPLSWLTEIMRPTTRIAEPDLRRAAVEQAAESRAGWLRLLISGILFERIERPERVWSQLGELAASLPAEQRRLLALATPIALIPRGVLLAARDATRLARRCLRRSVPA